MDYRIFQLSQLRAALHGNAGAAPDQACRQFRLRGLRRQSPRLVRQLRFFQLESRQAESARFRQKVRLTEIGPDSEGRFTFLMRAGAAGYGGGTGNGFRAY